MKTLSRKPVLEWTEYASDEMVRDYMEQYNDSQDDEDKINEQEAQKMLANDYYYWSNEWIGFKECLSELMAGREYWRDDATKMGWRSLSGYKVFQAEDGGAFIDAITPNTSEFTLSITPHYSGFKIRIGHHDAPMGEYHYVRPITEKVYNRALEYGY